MSKRFPWIIVTVILLLTTHLRFAAVANYNIALTYDQGRDLMEIRSIVIGHRPALVGPTTSINGVFLGPFYYYFNVIPFWLGKGNPAWIMGWQIIWYQLTGLLIFYFFHKRQQTIFAIILAFLYLLMPIGFYINHFFWNIAPMTPATIWVTLAILSILPTKQQHNNTAKRRSRETAKLLLTGLLTGIALQIEAAFGIFMFPLAIISLGFTKVLNFHKTLILLAGFSITLIPQLIYELRHQFPITTILYQQFTGQINILSQNLTFIERFFDRWYHYLRIIQDTYHLPPRFAIILFSIALIYTIIKLITCAKTLKIPILNSLFQIHYSLFPVTYYLLPITLLLLSIIFYLIFPPPLKSWYIDALSVPIIFITALFLTEIWHFPTYIIRMIISRFTSPTLLSSYLFKIPATIVLFFILINTVKEQFKYINQSQQFRYQDPSNLANQINIIDWIYRKAENNSFQVYSYLPSVYDHAYQHVFWWYGTMTYGYQPAKITYADNVPPYVKSANKLWTKIYNAPNNASPVIFLIIEPDQENPQRQSDWLSNYTHLCPIKQHTFTWRTRVELRRPCTNID